MRLSKDVFQAVMAMVLSGQTTTAERKTKDDDDGKGTTMELEFRYRNSATRQTGIDRAAFQTLIKYFRSMPHKYQERREACSLDVTASLGDKDGDKYRVSYQAGKDASNKDAPLQHLIERVQKSPESADAVLTKSGSKPVDYSDYDARIAWSRERIVKDAEARSPILAAVAAAKLHRFKRRFSFSVASADKSTKTSTGMRFDLTVVRQAGSVVALTTAPDVYEVELENDSISSSGSTLTTAIVQTALTAMFQQWSVLLKVVGDTDVVISNTEKNQVKAQYAKLTGQGDGDCRPLGPKLVTLEMHHLQDGVVFTKYAMTEKADGEHCLLFVDEAGQLFTIDDRLTVRFTGCRTSKYRNALLEAEYIAGKKMAPKILIFDVFYMNDKNVGQLPLLLPAAPQQQKQQTRASIVKAFVNDANIAPVVGVQAVPALQAKEFVPIQQKDEFFAAAKAILSKKAAGNFSYGIDGLILTPAHTAIGQGKYWGTWNEAFKWKPPQFNTIDFLVKIRASEAEIRDNELYKVADLYSAYSLAYTAPITSLMFLSNAIPLNKTRQLVPQPFQPPDKPDAYLAYLKVNDDGKLICEEGGEILDDTIVEMRYDVREGMWHPLRLRDDKTEKYLKTGDIGGTANKFETALSVWRSIQTPITEEIITGRASMEPVSPNAKQQQGEKIAEDSKLQMYYTVKSERRLESATASLRAFHNRWVKGTHLMLRFASRVSSVADFGCGRAGDLPKWKDMGAKKVLGLDLFADNLRNPRDGAHERALKHLRGTAPAYGIPKMAFLPADLRKLFDASYVNAMDDEHGDRTAAQVLMAMIPTSAPALKTSSHLLKYHGFARTGFELVSCQFAVHYFFESKDTLRNFVQNLATFLQPGGYFVGTCLDALKVDDALRDVSKGSYVQGVKNGSVIWQIMRMYDALNKTDPLANVGLKIRVFMESIGQAMVEYLVDINLLVAALAEVGIHPLTPDECTLLFGKKGDTAKMSTGLFSELYADMVEHITTSKKPDTGLELARNMDDVEKEYSFLNRWFVFRRRMTST